MPSGRAAYSYPQTNVLAHANDDGDADRDGDTDGDIDAYGDNDSHSDTDYYGDRYPDEFCACDHCYGHDYGDSYDSDADNWLVANADGDASAANGNGRSAANLYAYPNGRAANGRVHPNGYSDRHSHAKPLTYLAVQQPPTPGSLPQAAGWQAYHDIIISCVIVAS